MALKRQAWDCKVLVTVKTKDRVQTLTFDPSDLVEFAFFRNLPLPDADEDCVRVDLVEGKLSPWPVDGNAFQALVYLCSPLALFGVYDPDDHVSVLHKVLEDHSTSFSRLLDCAEALILDFRDRQGPQKQFDSMAADFVENAHLFCIAFENGIADVSYTNGWCKNSQGWPFAAEASWHGGDDSWRGLMTAKAVLPVARWAAGQTYRMLDRLSLRQAQAVLAKVLVNPGDKLLYGDDRWRQQLKDWSMDVQLSPAGRSILFDTALDAGRYESEPDMPQSSDLPVVQCTRLELFGSDLQLAPGIKLKPSLYSDTCMDLVLQLTQAAG